MSGLMCVHTRKGLPKGPLSQHIPGSLRVGQQTARPCGNIVLGPPAAYSPSPLFSLYPPPPSFRWGVRARGAREESRWEHETAWHLWEVGWHAKTPSVPEQGKRGRQSHRDMERRQGGWGRRRGRVLRHSRLPVSDSCTGKRSMRPALMPGRKIHKKGNGTASYRDRCADVGWRLRHMMD